MTSLVPVLLLDIYFPGILLALMVVPLPYTPLRERRVRTLIVTVLTPPSQRHWLYTGACCLSVSLLNKQIYVVQG